MLEPPYLACLFVTWEEGKIGVQVHFWALKHSGGLDAEIGRTAILCSGRGCGGKADGLGEVAAGRTGWRACSVFLLAGLLLLWSVGSRGWLRLCGSWA